MRALSVRDWSRIAYPSAVLVVAWRVTAYLVPDEGAAGWLRAALATLGLIYVACGLVAFLWWKGTAVRLFVFSALCSGLHWGGPVGVSNLTENALSVGVYVVLSSVLGETLFLHFVVELGPRGESKARRWWVVAMYVPVASASLLVPVIVGMGTGPGLGSIAVNGLLGAYGVATGFAYLAAAVLFVRLFRAPSRSTAAWVLSGLVMGALPGLLYNFGVPLPGPYEVYNLATVLTPLAVLLALRDRATTV